MASRLYGTTRQLFVRVSATLSQLGLSAMLSPTVFALLALYVTGLILLDRRQRPWRMQEWLPARCHNSLSIGLSIDYIAFDAQYTAGWFTKFVGRCGLHWAGTLSPTTVVCCRNRRYQGRELAERLHLRWRECVQLRAQAITVYAPKCGTLRLLVARNRHGNYEYIVSNDLGADLTTLVRRKRSRWSIETVFRDTKQFAGLEACQVRLDQALARHVAFELLTFVALQALRRHPEETLGAVYAPC